jgi:hypothetical protein
MASGSSRSALRSALAKLSVCGPTSRWLIRHFLLSCTNSIGSSTVSTWPYSFSLRWLTIAASVVLLPDPVGPVHSTMPRGLSASSANTLGVLSCSSVRILLGNGAEHRAGAAVLVEGVDAKARQALDLEREVALQRVFVVLALGVVHDVVHHVVHRLVVQRVDVDAPHVAVHADHRRQAGRQVQVRGLVLDGKGQQLGDVHRHGDRRSRARSECGAQGAGVSGDYGQHRKQPARSEGPHQPGLRPPAARDENSVTLLAVSKTFGADAVRQAHAAGQRAFGENYVQEALAKIEALADLRAQLQWHLIGPLQSNKTRPVAEAFDWVQSVDR